MKNYRSYQNGFSLLELLLAISIITILTTSIAVVFDNWAKDRQDRIVASEMIDVQNAAENFVNLNFQDIRDTTLINIGAITQININDLIVQGFLPENFRARNSYGHDLLIMARLISDDSTSGDVIEVITASENPVGQDKRVRNNRLMNYARSGGPSLGVISALNLGTQCCDGNIQSIFNSWSVDLSDFNSIYNQTPNDDGGFVAAYGRVTTQNFVDNDYLYRIEFDGRPELNRMNTDLDMNQNDIINAGVVVADRSEVSGNAEFLGQEDNALQSVYVLSVRDNLSIDGETTISNISDNGKGNLIVRGDSNSASNDFIVGGALSSQSASAEVMTVSGNATIGSGTFGGLDLNNQSLSAGNIYITTIETPGSIDVSGDLQASRITNLDNLETDLLIANQVSISGGSSTISANIDVEDTLFSNDGITVDAITGEEYVDIESLTCDSPAECP